MPATKDYWPLVLENIRGSVKDSAYKAWFSRVEFVKTSNQGRKIILSVPNSFSKKYIESKYKQGLLDSINKYYPQVIHVDFSVEQVQDDEQFVQQTLTPTHNKPVLTPNSSKKPKLAFDVFEADSTNEVASYLPKKNINNLNPKYTFENFVVTNNNEFAANVAKAVIDQPGQIYNPVFLHSGVGLGKTHLIQAIGHKMLENNPSYNIKYIPMETFVSQFQIAVRKGEMQGFKNYYRTIDLLLIDDVQFISGKESTQNEFFHTFNSLIQSNKQIILTSDRHPSELNGVADRLISRFNSGVTVDISKPDLESRVAILNDKIERLHLPLSDFQIQSIAQKVDTNVRELEGILNKVCAKIKFSPGQNFTDSDLDGILSNSLTSKASFLPAQNPGAATERIMHAVCRYFGLDKADVLGVSRQRDISTARQIIMWFYKYDLDLSYPAIGRLFGNRDHTTVMHAANKIKKLYASDPKMKEKLEIIRTMLAKA